MSELLIFGGTTEGRQLAEFCSENDIRCGISVATEYGAALLPENVTVYTGRMDTEQMKRLMTDNGYTAVVDATHPYAAEATDNIRRACEEAAIPYHRLLRECSELYGEVVSSMEQLTERLSQDDAVILSTLGSKSLEALRSVRNYRERIWVRVLGTGNIRDYCRSLGYDEKKLICERGPFSTEQNIAHIRLSGAQLLVTKESGAVGGYPEKIRAARECGIPVITLARPSEKGHSLSGIKELLLHCKEAEQQ
ncbi:MAG: precorrin-6A reductase [Ruminococcus sp.]|nr:precorrin-6A reductase [Ruminococcus sp.]